MFMTPKQMDVALPYWQRLLEDGVDTTDERGFDEAVRNIEFRPDSPRTRVYRLDPKVMEKAEDPGPDFEDEFNPFEVHRQPLPLAEVMENLKALHRGCNGRHVCGIPVKYREFNPERFDLGTWADLVSAHKRHVAAGIKNRAHRNGRPR